MRHIQIQSYVLVSALLALSSCNTGGGGGGGDVGIPGVTASSYSDNGVTCTVNTNNYTCTDSMYGRNTGVISFSSKQDFCSKIMNENINFGVASSVRQRIYNIQCSGTGTGVGTGGIGQTICPNGQPPVNNMCLGQNGTSTGTISQPISGMKNFLCSMTMSKGNARGNFSNMNVAFFPSGNTVDLFAYMSSNKSILGGLLNWNSIFTSNRYGRVQLTFKPGNSGVADMLKLQASGIDGDISASVEGFAGSNVELTIQPNDDVTESTYLNVSCSSNEATQLGSQPAYTKYLCTGSEKAGTKSTTVNLQGSYSGELMGQTYKLGSEVELTTEGALSAKSGFASFVRQTNLISESTITTRSNITTPSTMTIRKSGYSANITCRPVL